MSQDTDYVTEMKTTVTKILFHPSNCTKQSLERSIGVSLCSKMTLLTGMKLIFISSWRNALVL